MPGFLTTVLNENRGDAEIGRGCELYPVPTLFAMIVFWMS